MSKTSKTSKPSKPKASLDLNDESEPVNGFEQDAKTAKAGKAKPVAKPETVKAGKAKPVAKVPGRPSSWVGKTLISTDYPCREGTIRAKFKAVFANGIDAEKGVAKVADGFSAPRSEKFNADPIAFVRAHVSTYLKRGWLVEA